MKTIIAILILALAVNVYAQKPGEDRVQIPGATSNPAPDVLTQFMPRETWFLPTGQEIKATIQNAIFSFNLQTPVIATVDDPVISPKDGTIILPKKTRLIGTADILKSDDRVNVRFIIAVLPNGREFEINGIALSPDGSAGIKGTVKEYKDARFMSSALSGAMSGMGQAVVATLPGQPIVAGAIGGALVQGAQEAQTISNQKVDVSISVPPFQKTFVFLSRRLVLDDLPKGDRNPKSAGGGGKDNEEKPKDWKKE